MAGSVVPITFENLDFKWQDVLQNCPVNNIFLTLEWQQAWWQVFGNGYKPCLLSIQENGETIGIAPLKQEGEKLSLIGSNDVCDYRDFIVKRGYEITVFSQLLDYIEPMEWNMIELESLLPESLSIKYFAPLARTRGLRVDVKQTDVSPQLFLPSSWEFYLTSLKAKDRHELRRKMRRLERYKADIYTVKDKVLLPKGMETFFELFSLSGIEKANFMNDKRKDFFKTLTTSLAEKGYLRLYFMDVGGQPKAASLCFEYENEIYLYNSAYDPSCAELSVSLLLDALCIREAIDKGRKRFDFLRGNEAYKYDLGGKDVPLYQCVITRS